jgi:hypothetical protein
MHSVVEAHATLSSRLHWAPLGLGVDWIAQLVPFQRSANNSGSPVSYTPTAVHTVVDAQATPTKTPGSLGLGLDWIAQEVPFQRSARVPSLERPTAVHTVVEAQATADSSPLPGVDWVAQLLPFQCSAKGPPE